MKSWSSKAKFPSGDIWTLKRVYGFLKFRVKRPKEKSEWIKVTIWIKFEILYTSNLGNMIPADLISDDQPESLKFSRVSRIQKVKFAFPHIVRNHDSYRFRVRKFFKPLWLLKLRSLNIKLQLWFILQTSAKYKVSRTKPNLDFRFNCSNNDDIFNEIFNRIILLSLKRQSIKEVLNSTVIR